MLVSLTSHICCSRTVLVIVLLAYIFPSISYHASLVGLAGQFLDPLKVFLIAAISVAALPPLPLFLGAIAVVVALNVSLVAGDANAVMDLKRYYYFFYECLCSYHKTSSKLS